MPELLGPWEPEAENSSTEVRRARAGTVVVTLFPEGLLDSRCWAWVIHTAEALPQRFGCTYGSDVIKDVARGQADTAVRAFGYEPGLRPTAVTTTAAAVGLMVINMPLAGAAEMAQQAGVQFRIGSQDGRIRLLTDDWRLDRITVTVLDGIVTQSRVG